jgi:UDP-glucose 4-epimerase
MKKILVTGGLGYVGGRIILHLLSLGNYEVYISTRRKTVETAGLFPRGDVSIIDAAQLEDNNYFFPVIFDSIIHLAGWNEIDSAKDPVSASEYNIISSLKLLRLAIKNNTKQFIYFSTAHVYGSPLQGNITEKSLARPIHPYAISHKGFEDFVLAARDKGEIDGIVLRLSNSFGAPVWPDVNRWSLLVNDLCKQAIRTGVLRLNSNGLQERDFIPLSDVAAATAFFLETEKTATGNGLFNLSGNCTLTVLEMTSIIKERCREILQKDIPVSLLSGGVTGTGTAHLQLRNDKLKALGFTPRLNTTEEIDNLLIFCKIHFSLQDKILNK